MPTNAKTLSRTRVALTAETEAPPEIVFDATATVRGSRAIVWAAAGTPEPGEALTLHLFAGACACAAEKPGLDPIGDHMTIDDVDALASALATLASEMRSDAAQTAIRRRQELAAEMAGCLEA